MLLLSSSPFVVVVVVFGCFFSSFYSYSHSQPTNLAARLLAVTVTGNGSSVSVSAERMWLACWEKKK